MNKFQLHRSEKYKNAKDEDYIEDYPDQADVNAVNTKDVSALVATASALKFENMNEDQLLIQLSTHLDAALTSETRGDGDPAVAKTTALAIKDAKDGAKAEEDAAEGKARADAEALEVIAKAEKAKDVHIADAKTTAVAQQFLLTETGHKETKLII